MITIEAFFSDTLGTVDAVIGNFVQTAYTNFVAANNGIITLLFTFYVMGLGYRFLTHQQTDLSHIIRHFVVMLCVYGMIMNWQLYHLFIYDIFTNEPGHIATILVNSADHIQFGDSIAKALDGIYESVWNAAKGFLGQINFSPSAFSFLFYAFLILLIGSALCIIALLLFVYAKMMMAVTLALGPLFILFIMWDETKDIFGAWLRKLITIALIPIVTSSILVLMLSVINVTLPKLNQPINSLQFFGIAPFLGLSLTATLILSQVFRICSALGGGITLSSLSKGMDIAKTAFNKSGATVASRAVGNWSKKKIASTSQRLLRSKHVAK